MRIGSAVPHQSSLIGREAELKRVGDFFAQVATGQPGLILVAGEAGVGKTRLITAGAERFRAAGVRVLFGNCLDLHTARLPYAPIAGALRQGPPRLVDHAVDAITGAVEVSEPRMYELLRTAFTRLAEEQPTLVIVEDLHWIDPATRDAILLLLDTARSGRWALVGTYRDTEVRVGSDLRDLLEQLVRHRPLERVFLARLSPDEVAAQVGELTGARPDDNRAARLHRRSDGIPLLVEELVAAEGTDAADGAPRHLHELFVSRLSALSPEAGELVRVASVTGSSTPGGVLLKAAQLVTGSEAAATEEAVSAGCLLVRGGECGFRHELLREAVYDSLVPERRRELNARVATALVESGSTDQAGLARHWYEAGELPLAAVASWHAAAAAERVHAQPATLTHLERVLELWEHLPDEFGGRAGELGAVVSRAAVAAYLAGLYGRALQLGEEAVAHSHGDPVANAVSLERLARYRWVAGHGASSASAYEEALRALPGDAPPDARTQVLAGYGWFLGFSGRRDELHPIVGDLMATAERTGDALHGARAYLIASLLPENGYDEGQRARELARQVDAVDELSQACVRVAILAATLGFAREGLAAAREGAQLAEHHQMIGGYRVLLAGYEAWHLIDLGRWDEAQSCLDRVLPVTIQDNAGAWAAMHAVRLAAGRGQSDVTLERAKQVVAICDRAPQNPTPRLVAQCGCAEDLLWSGEPDRAWVTVIDTLEVVRDRPEFPDLEAALVSAGIRAAADMAERSRQSGTESDIAPIADQVTDLIDRIANPAGARTAAHAATAHAERARFDNVREPEAWRAAVRDWDEIEDTYRAAYVRWRLAQLLASRRAGRREAAETLQDAWKVATALGTTPLRVAIERTAAVARLAVGVSPPELDAAAAAARQLGLTAREVEVLHLVARGRTNKEIAKVLFISPRTVGVHVSRLLTKLGAARRTEAVEVARVRGVLAS